MLNLESREWASIGWGQGDASARVVLASARPEPVDGW